jgi:FkbM family methyltransferase
MSLVGWMMRPGLWFRRDAGVLEAWPGQSGRQRRLVRVAKFGIYIDPEDTLIGAGIAKYGQYEPYLTKLITRFLNPGDTFLDLGANVGYHTLTAAARVGRQGRCIAVDLNPDNCQLLRASCELNGFSQVEVHEKAAAAQTGFLSFFTTPNTGNSALLSEKLKTRMPGESQWLGETEQRVEAVAVDDLVGDESVHLVKIDVEGSEAGAFAGMKRILSKQRPPVLFEFFPKLLKEVGDIESFELLDMIRGHRYHIHRLSPRGKISRMPFSNEAVMPPEGQMLNDLIALPR